MQQHVGIKQGRLHTRTLPPKPVMKKTVQSRWHSVRAASRLLRRLLVTDADCNVSRIHFDEVCMQKKTSGRGTTQAWVPRHGDARADAGICGICKYSTLGYATSMYRANCDEQFLRKADQGERWGILFLRLLSSKSRLQNGFPRSGGI